MRWKVIREAAVIAFLSNAVAHSQSLQVLVYDDAGEHAVCTLFKIAQLRAQGVTVFYNINGTRERGPVPDAPAVCVYPCTAAAAASSCPPTATSSLLPPPRLTPCAVTCGATCVHPRHLLLCFAPF
jgi:hypothetical protein